MIGIIIPHSPRRATSKFGCSLCQECWDFGASYSWKLLVERRALRGFKHEIWGLPNPRSPGTHIGGSWVIDSINLHRDSRTGTQYVKDRDLRYWVQSLHASGSHSSMPAVGF